MIAAPEKPSPRKTGVTQVWRDIFASAQRMFAERGYTGVSISDVATDAGIAKSTVLHHFPNKQKLYEAVVQASLAEFSGLTGSFAADANSRNSIATNLQALLRWMVTEPVHAKLLNRVFMDNPRTAALAARKYWRPLLTHLMADIKAGDDYEKAEATILFAINAIFQIAFSIELQLRLIGDKTDVQVLCNRYAPVINSLVAALPA